MKSEINCALAPEPQALSQHVFLEKYAGPGERTHRDVHVRVARALARDESQEARFLAAQQAGFVPGGRINSAAGHERVSTMINCFVQPIEDSMTGSVKGMPGIMGALAEATETMRRGGGVGYDFSRLRPFGAKVKGTESTASGPVSYMRVFDTSCSTVESAGQRRGAQMGVLRVDHPDIEMFVDAKRAPDFSTLGLNAQECESLTSLIRGKPEFGWAMRGAFATLSNFNISVGVTDAFMNAVMADEEFELVHEAPPAFEAATTVGQDGVARYVYRRIRAKDLWTKIMRNTYESADPGVLFLDTVNRRNNLRYCETIHASNPCGEQMLPAYGACCLGSQNLTRLVRMPFTDNAYFDVQAFDEAIAGAVELLDRVLDITNWPLPQQEAEARSKRRIGVGFFGLASAMAMLGLRYGSPESAQFAGTVACRMRDAAYRASVELAKKLGPFELFDAENYLADGTFASTLPQEIQDSIRKFGIRNSHLLSIAPTGTTALAFGDNASSGIEPIFDLTTFRNVRTGRGDERETWQADDYAWRVQQLVQGKDARPDSFVTAQQLTVEGHLVIVEAVAPFVDSAISKTVNVPKDYPFEEFEAIYLEAWKRGLKGITTYRPNDMVGAVLVSQEDHASSMSTTELRADDPDRRVEIKDVPNVVERLKWPSRPDVVAEGVTYSVRHPGGDHAVVVNHWLNGVRHPLEVYIAGNEQPRGLAAIAKSISVDMRTDDSRFLAMKLDSLLNTRGDDGFEMTDPGTGLRVHMPSLTAGFAALVKHRLVELGALEGGGQSPFIDALFSKREPKTGAEGAIGWHVDINNPATGDDFLLHTKELKLPDGTIRPYSVWLSGQYPKVLDGLMKVLSIDMRISDPGWVAMKLRKLTDFGEVRGDFLAQVPGEARQQNYPSTVAYIAEVLLARMNKLGLLGRELAAPESPAGVAGSGLLGGSGRQCPSCHALALHKVAGCEVCSNCDYTGSCG
jgi:ribonucleoside-diphosphate reductase alpha chain